MKDFNPIFFKFKKYHNYLIVHKLKKKEFKHFKLIIGNIGLKALKSYTINNAQLNSCIKTIIRECKRQYKLWLYCMPNVSLTSKSISVRMGTGIGAIKDWVFVIKKNKIFIEVISKYKYGVFKGLKKCKKKLPFPTKIVTSEYKKKWKYFNDI